MSQLTTHILDTTKGKPAWGVTVVVYRQIAGEWIKLGKGLTNKDGRITNLLAEEYLMPFGTYKLSFDTKHYYEGMEIETFYPHVDIVFQINSTDHYHVPLLVSPFGYSTYRGS